MKPYVVESIHDAMGRAVFQAVPQVRRKPISQETARVLTSILEGVVARGTGSKAAVPGFRVAGKTGTAQKIDPKKGAYSATKFVGSFVGFVPAEDPRLAIVAVIDEPQGEGWGGVVAAPVFRRVAEQALSYLGVYAPEPARLAMLPPGMSRTP